jgi:hypothetical protein
VAYFTYHAISSSIHYPASQISFFLFAEKYSIGYICHIFFIHSSVDRHLGWFHILAIVNGGVINMGVHVSFLHADLHSFRYMPKSGIAGDHIAALFLVV